jgi:hypothetical protein
MRIRVSRLGRIGFGGALLLGSLTIGVSSLAASGSAAGPSASSLDVVGGPIAVGTTAVVISVSQAHTLVLSGVNPVSNTVLWQHPYSASLVTPGEYLSPAAAGNTVLDLAPAGKPSNPLITISGIDASTGAKEWQLPATFEASDNPAVCASGQDFCVVGYNTDGSTDLVLIDASTGQPKGLISGPSRALAPNLYQSDASTPTLEQLSPSGTIAWTKTVAAIFGPGYEPGAGWNITPLGNINIGSVGPTSKGNAVDMGANKTLGIDLSTGATAWSIAGSYMCMGPLEFLTTQVSCQYTGTMHYTNHPNQPPSTKGVTLKLAGINPFDGAATWSVPVSDIEALTTGDGLSFLNGTDLAVRLAGGKPALLNTSTGATAPLKSGQILWCQKVPIFKVLAVKGIEDGGLRASTPVFSPCTTSGKATHALPTSFPSTVGVTVNGVFVWASSTGLHTHVVGTPRTIT